MRMASIASSKCEKMDGHGQADQGQDPGQDDQGHRESRGGFGTPASRPARTCDAWPATRRRRPRRSRPSRSPARARSPVAGTLQHAARLRFPDQEHEPGDQEAEAHQGQRGPDPGQERPLGREEDPRVVDRTQPLGPLLILHFRARLIHRAAPFGQHDVSRLSRPSSFPRRRDSCRAGYSRTRNRGKTP